MRLELGEIHISDIKLGDCSKVENGTPAVINEVLEGWDLYQQHRP